MAKEKEEKWDKKWEKKKWHNHASSGMFGCFGFLTFIGAAVYFIQQVSGFWPIVLAILKAVVWPAFLVYKVFTLLHM
jgi:hypothetical protein